MPDFSSAGAVFTPRGVLSSMGKHTLINDMLITQAAGFSTAGAWPANNRAFYIPFVVESPMTVARFGFTAGATTAGSVCFGIYRWGGTTSATQLVSTGGTSVAGSGFQTVDCTDTTLNPGYYMMAMNCSASTNLVFRTTALQVQALRLCGVHEQAVGATALPTVATLTSPPTSAYLPFFVAGPRDTL